MEHIACGPFTKLDKMDDMIDKFHDKKLATKIRNRMPIYYIPLMFYTNKYQSSPTTNILL
jgi:hypothetical protein